MDGVSSGQDLPAVRRAARGLEAALIRRMLQAMEKAQLDSGLFGSSAGSKTRQTHFRTMLSKVLAEEEPLGIAEAVSRQLAGGAEAGTGKTETKKDGSGVKIGDRGPMSLTERTALADLRSRAVLEERE